VCYETAPVVLYRFSVFSSSDGCQDEDGSVEAYFAGVVEFWVLLCLGEERAVETEDESPDQDIEEFDLEGVGGGTRGRRGS
jgi:hypothetical protein